MLFDSLNILQLFSGHSFLRAFLLILNSYDRLSVLRKIFSSALFRMCYNKCYYGHNFERDHVLFGRSLTNLKFRDWCHPNWEFQCAKRMLRLKPAVNYHHIPEMYSVRQVIMEYPRIDEVLAYHRLQLATFLLSEY